MASDAYVLRVINVCIMLQSARRRSPTVACAQRPVPACGVDSDTHSLTMALSAYVSLSDNITPCICEDDKLLC
jgi:hypothetical protein